MTYRLVSSVVQSVATLITLSWNLQAPFKTKTSTGKRVPKSENMGLRRKLVAKKLINKCQEFYIIIFYLEVMKQNKNQSEFPSPKFKVKSILSKVISLSSKTFTKKVSRLTFGLKARAS